MHLYSSVVDHLVVVSMNHNPDAWFWETAKSKAYQYGMATFYVNAAQVVEPADTAVDMAFWYLPIHRKSVGTADLEPQTRFRRVLPPATAQQESLKKLPPPGWVEFVFKIPAPLRSPWL
jgi:hypothetical protein